VRGLTSENNTIHTSIQINPPELVYT